MLHGSEPGTKDNFGNQQMSTFMASQGIAILTYDKRGVGESEGSYVESASERNLSLTAQDAIWHRSECHSYSIDLYVKSASEFLRSAFCLLVYLFTYILLTIPLRSSSPPPYLCAPTGIRYRRGRSGHKQQSSDRSACASPGHG